MSKSLFLKSFVWARSKRRILADVWSIVFTTSIRQTPQGGKRWGHETFFGTEPLVLRKLKRIWVGCAILTCGTASCAICVIWGTRLLLHNLTHMHFCFMSAWGMSCATSFVAQTEPHQLMLHNLNNLYFWWINRVTSILLQILSDIIFSCGV